MRMKSRLLGALSATALIVGLLAVPTIASAHTGEFAKFNYCPSTNPAVVQCLYSVTAGGEVTLGNKKVPIVNPVTLQGGFGEANETTNQSTFYAATNGDTLSKTPQPVPGGLTGLVNCKEISNFILRASCEVVFENGLTGVNATLELAQPASNIKISVASLLFRKGAALVLPVKVHLENPLLGSTCYVGSSSSPLIWNLTTGTTAPPAPNKPISGAVGTATEIEMEQILKISGTKLVDNAWSAPGASGCGGPIWEYILNPIINSSVGVPAAAGHNTAIQEKVTLYSSPVEFVNAH